MNSNKRHELLTTGRGAELRDVLNGMTNRAVDGVGGLPTKSQLRASLAEIYPGDENAELRESLFEQAKKLAVARRDGANVMELRGRVDELVVRIETKLIEDDRILPIEPEQEIDYAGMADSIIEEARRMEGWTAKVAVGEQINRNLYNPAGL